ncbi:hypothetical protein [Motiliproteus sp. MSK22-1]|uniref:hypothetical protein n=1 Tax=Motiliproteus sp. MSK22-1 TaxID=1897630 RepID=UPI000977ED0F|nr:hypothetical protein [Motiliproteus sp. MSK22-1]OMH32097.1 hypothetical protein BGP75_15450 [Motiliproteus sp. MSK22-1]
MFASIFLYVYWNDFPEGSTWAKIIIGSAFILASAACFRHLIQDFNRVRKDGGFLTCELGQHGIQIAKQPYAKTEYYPWELVEEICTCEVIKTIGSDTILTWNNIKINGDGDGGATPNLSTTIEDRIRTSHRALIVFIKSNANKKNKNFFYRLKNRIMRSPTGRYYTYTSFPSPGNEVRDKINFLLKDKVLVNSYNEVNFDYHLEKESYH